MATRRNRPDDLPKWSNTLGMYLDLSKKNTGYAVMLGYELLHHGEQSFQKHKRDGPMLVAFRDWLVEILDAGEFDILGVEYAAFQKGRAQELFHSMLGVAKLCAAERDMNVIGIFPGQIKLAAAHYHLASKDQVIAAINKQFGLELTSHDIADAIGCGLATADASGEQGTGRWM